jgi:uncharacterized protein (DUF488 family)
MRAARGRRHRHRQADAICPAPAHRPIKIFTIGFTQKTAEEFFRLLHTLKVRRVIDIRLHNVSQLAGFAKRDDLQYFLRSLAGIGYVHRPDLAPTQHLLDALRKPHGDWHRFEAGFLRLLQSRRIERSLNREMLDRSCLLCSEHLPDRCHRRLVAEHLQRYFPLQVEHLR